MGCQLTVTVDGENVTVEGNTCPRGAVYGKKEVTAPTRTVTSTVVVEGGELPRVSVKTATDIPKGMIFAVMEEIRAARVTAPVHIGDVIIANAAGSGADVIATKTVRKAEN
jgi:CxxC motif-containing protein